MGWEELADGVHRRRPDRTAPRPGSRATTGRRNKASYRIERHRRRRLPRGRPTARWLERRRGAERDDLGLRAARADGDLPRDRADRPLRRARRSDVAGADDGGAARRLGSVDFDAAFGRQPEMMDALRPALRPLPVRVATPSWSPRTSSRSRSRRRACRSSASNFLTDDWDAVRLVAHELSHQWFGNSLTLASLARHLAARGVRLLRRVAVVGGVGRPVGRRTGRRALEAARADLPQDLAARRPRARRHVRRPRLQARRAAAARAAADGRRRRRSSSCSQALGCAATPTAR